MIHRVAEAGFAADPERYERGRPGYPAAVMETIGRFAALEPHHRILDLAAGTGKLTRLLPRDLRIVAVEPVRAMRQYLARMIAGIDIVGGVAEALPFADQTFRLITVGQAFHWFDAGRAWRQFERVLEADGAVALVWNARDRSIDWVDQIWSIMDRAERDAPWRDHDRAQRFDTGGAFGPPVESVYRHEVGTTVDGMVDRIVSVSHVAVLPLADRLAVADEVRRTLATHPDTAGRDTLTVPYRTDLYLFRRT